MVLYEAILLYQRIAKIEVERVTKKSYWVKDSRCLRITEYRAAFDTWEEAHA